MAFCSDSKVAAGRLRMALLTIGFLPAIWFSAADAGQPYAVISRRNAFHLKPRPTPVTEGPRAPLPKIHLTGITTIFQDKRALLKVELPGKPPNTAQSFILTEGQKDGPLQVLQINEKTALVKVDYLGTVTNLTFEKLMPTVVPTARKPPVRWGGIKYRPTLR
jgi:hypothetical protein